MSVFQMGVFYGSSNSDAFYSSKWKNNEIGFGKLWQRHTH